MKKIISEFAASKSLLAALSAIMLFHVLVIINVIPYEIIGGGRARNRGEIINLELISIIVNAIMIFVVLIRTGPVRLFISGRWLRILFCLMFAFFLLNTLGNLFSINQIEKFIFTPLTLFLSFCSLWLALVK